MTTAIVIEVTSHGVARPEMSSPRGYRQHRSTQTDTWMTAYRSQEAVLRFEKLIEDYLVKKVIGREYGWDVFKLLLTEPLMDDEAVAISIAATKLYLGRFDGDDAPKTMHECLHD